MVVAGAHLALGKRAIVRTSPSEGKPRAMFALMNVGPSSPARPERKVYTVTQLNSEVRMLLERGLPSSGWKGSCRISPSPPQATGTSRSRIAMRRSAARCSASEISPSDSRRASASIFSPAAASASTRRAATISSSSSTSKKRASVRYGASSKCSRPSLPPKDSSRWSTSGLARLSTPHRCHHVADGRGPARHPACARAPLRRRQLCSSIRRRCRARPRRRASFGASSSPRAAASAMC